MTEMDPILRPPNWISSRPNLLLFDESLFDEGQDYVRHYPKGRYHWRKELPNWPAQWYIGSKVTLKLIILKIYVLYQSTSCMSFLVAIYLHAHGQRN